MSIVNFCWQPAPDKALPDFSNDNVTKERPEKNPSAKRHISGVNVPGVGLAIRIATQSGPQQLGTSMRVEYIWLEYMYDLEWAACGGRLLPHRQESQSSASGLRVPPGTPWF